MSARPEVKVGQVWLSCDARDVDSQGHPTRQVKVTLAGTTHAFVVNTVTGQRSRIRLDRFKPGSTGWKLVSEGGAA